ncbi:hypothetical protein THARTR1_08393 [Trichoderma harzianum]|uniref:Uncharacterized protein n=1 Tax=Trichoderma harzianum TaxID=5544 RepID=A0A2K0TZ06_TRIHA|nr:hypothetical protein THARTR1_08393 [Trichoderma harzianum]
MWETVKHRKQGKQEREREEKEKREREEKEKRERERQEKEKQGEEKREEEKQEEEEQEKQDEATLDSCRRQLQGIKQKYQRLEQHIQTSKETNEKLGDEINKMRAWVLIAYERFQTLYEEQPVGEAHQTTQESPDQMQETQELPDQVREDEKLPEEETQATSEEVQTSK